MTDVRRVVQALRTLVWAHTVLGSSPHRIRAWQRASDVFERWNQGELADALHSGRLKATAGVGKSTLALVQDVIDGDESVALREVRQQLPESLFALRRVRGLGPKRTAALYNGLGVTSLAELAYACHENRLVTLPGFGPTLQDRVARECARIQAESNLFRRDQAHIAFVQLRVQHPDVVLVGALRRGHELVDGVDVLSGEPLEPQQAAIPVTVHVGEPSAIRRWWQTAAIDHRKAVVAHAARRGLRLSESGLMQKRKALDVPTTDALYELLGLTPLPEERWEGATLSVGQHRPRLVQRKDLRGALHNHTTASDGSGTAEQMREAAAQRGLEWLHISDHSHSAHYAGGLDADRLAEQVRTLRTLPAHACHLFTGVEADILHDGQLDHPTEVLAQVDVVIASIHDRRRQSGDVLTDRLCCAAEHAHVIGHPTGRLLLGRPAADIDMERLLKTCVQTGCALELNANPHRLDLSAEHAAMAKEAGVLVSIAADAHAPHELSNLDHGIAVARRAGLTPDDVVNTRTTAELQEWASGRAFG